MRLFVIGDIHGCLNELIRLLALVDNTIEKDDQIVFIGDYIDRGPDSKGVIDLLIERNRSHPNKHIFLRGNHEDMMMTGEHYWGLNGGIETLQSYGLTVAEYGMGDWLAQIPETHRAFLENTQIYYKVGRTVCVHAGLDPGVSLEEQSEKVMLWDRRFYKYVGQYHDDEYVVIGHTPGHEVQETVNQLALDTACVFGGKLSCAIIHPETGVVTDVIQVKSEFSY